MQTAWRKAEVPNPLQVVTDGEEAILYFKGDADYGDRRNLPNPTAPFSVFCHPARGPGGKKFSGADRDPGHRRNFFFVEQARAKFRRLQTESRNVRKQIECAFGIHT